ncbi:hypothetical protein Taro_053057 [Colocasia esculenta]|uniref:Uncharacterized protein n=1 Tax=Colocasia esculenta TaxID=4460 RepID=A0A843XLG7_COLES|nr:hypothetical protein [Colocasia esculenta]
MQKGQNVTHPCKGHDRASRSRRGHVRVATGSTDRAARSRRPVLSRSDRDGTLYRDAPMNAAYRAVAFTGSVPESNRESTEHWIADQTFQGLNLKNSGKNLEDPSSPRILLSLGSFPRPATPWHELGPAMRVLNVEDTNMRKPSSPFSPYPCPAAFSHEEALQLREERHQQSRWSCCTEEPSPSGLQGFDRAEEPPPPRLQGSNSRSLPRRRWEVAGRAVAGRDDEGREEAGPQEGISNLAEKIWGKWGRGVSRELPGRVGYGSLDVRSNGQN